MQAMIQYLYPPKRELPSILTSEIDRLSGANHKAVAVRLDALAPSLMAIDASKADIGHHFFPPTLLRSPLLSWHLLAGYAPNPPV